jgi:hypothetical protein
VVPGGTRISNKVRNYRANMDTPPLAKVHSIEYLYPSIYHRAAQICTQSFSSTLIPYSYPTITIVI